MGNNKKNNYSEKITITLCEEVSKMALQMAISKDEEVNKIVEESIASRYHLIMYDAGKEKTPKWRTR